MGDETTTTLSEKRLTINTHSANNDQSDHLRGRIVALLTAGILIGILVAGLWPFDFIPKNRVHWLPNGAGLRFDGYGQVYSSVRMPLRGGPDEPADATIELIFTPSKPYNTASTVFSVVNQNEVNFAIGQSLTDLFLQGSFTQSIGKPVAKLWVDRVCGHAQELFVTVTLDTRDLRVYLDGRLARSFPISTRTGNLSGRILIGHNVSGGGQWNGSVARLAIVNGTLDASRIIRRYEQWKAVRHLDNEVNHRGAVYEFGTPAEDFVRNEGEMGPDLIIPENFRLLKPNILMWPEHLNVSVAVDAVVNTAGFIPLGLGICLCLRFWTERNISRCVAMTILVGFSVSLAIELLQVFLPTRVSSLADLVTNAFGSAIGAGVAAIGRK